MTHPFVGSLVNRGSGGSTAGPSGVKLVSGVVVSGGAGRVLVEAMPARSRKTQETGEGDVETRLELKNVYSSLLTAQEQLQHKDREP